MSTDEESIDTSSSLRRPFTCNACGTSFKIKKNLLAHLRTHNEHPSTKSQVSYHINEYSALYRKKIGSAPRPYECPICGQSFKQRHHLQEHMIYRHSDDRPYNCSDCDQTFKQKRDCQNHEARVHKKKVVYSCSGCGLTYEQRNVLRRHITDKHQNDKTVRIHRRHVSRDSNNDVEIRGEEVTASMPNNEVEVAVHDVEEVEVIVQNDEEAEVIVQTDEEDVGFVAQADEEAAVVIPNNANEEEEVIDAVQRDLKAELVHKKIAKRKLSCARCGESFKQRRTLAKHLSEALCESRPFFSSDAKPEAASSPAVAANGLKKKKSGPRKRSSVGGAKIKNSKVVSSGGGGGGQRRGEGARPYHCGVCGNAFKQAGHLYEHLLYVHGDETPFRCSKCDKTFKRGRTLRLHMSGVHGSNVPYMCRECGESFECVKMLRKHTLSTHGKHSSIAKHFPSVVRSQIQKHVAIGGAQNEERPFRCGKCDQTFRVSVSLSKHYKKEHVHEEDDEDVWTGRVPNQQHSFAPVVQRKPSLAVPKNPISFHRLYACPCCAEAFEAYADLIEHAKSCEKYAVHAGRENVQEFDVLAKREYGCTPCGLEFHGSRPMSEHVQERHDSRFVFHWCERLICTKMSINVSMF